MSVGNSGRIVIEVDGELKKMLYESLKKDGLTLKEWFVRNARQYVSDAQQPSLFDQVVVESKKVAA